MIKNKYHLEFCCCCRCCCLWEKFVSVLLLKCFFQEDKILIKKNLRQLKGYTSTHFLENLKPKTGHDKDWITCGRKLTTVDLLIMWLTVVVPALLMPLTTLSKKWLVSTYLGHTSRINCDNFEPNCYINFQFC